MKKFETPIADIEMFEISDVITTSNTCDGYCTNQMPLPPACDTDED